MQDSVLLSQEAQGLNTDRSVSNSNLVFDSIEDSIAEGDR